MTLLLLPALLALTPSWGIGKTQTVSVFAAASLKEAFTNLARRYESLNPGTKVLLNFAGSQALAAQIAQGAKADVFASASMKNLLDAEPDRETVRIFARNQLVLVMRKGFIGVQSVKALERAPKIVMADKSVPAGMYAEMFLSEAARKFGNSWLQNVKARVVSRELDVRAVLTKVRLGEADAGIVYVSDVMSAFNEVRTLPIPENMVPEIKYPIALTKSAPNKAGGKRFLKYVFTREGQSFLMMSGFASSILPARPIQVTGSPAQTSLQSSLLESLPDETIEAAVSNRTTQRFKGKPVALVLKNLRGKVRFTGADDYGQTYDAKSLARGRAVFVRDADGNYGLVVKGFPSDSWVKWIRRIDLK